MITWKELKTIRYIMMLWMLIFMLSKSQNRIAYLTIIVVLATSLILAQPNAEGHGTVDQSNEGPFTGEEFFFSDSCQQGFTPTKDNLNSVDVFLIRGGFQGPVDVTVTIWEGEVEGTGTNLGSKTVSVPNIGATPSNPQIIHYDFASLIDLVPDNTYFIQVQGSDAAWVRTSSDVYAGGTAACADFGVFSPVSGDFGFRTHFEQQSCSLPVSGDWTVSSSCTLISSETVNGNVIVPNGVVLTIPNDVTLDINFATKNLTVQAGGGVLIQAGGTIT